ncbi:MAG: trigger factor [Candidatus Gracilibacteria bacterium]|nr:trigger factor [Candidatus Gracilibacteria bacterium]
MKITRKDLDNSIVELIVETDTKTVAKSRNKVLNYLREKADIKGFRKGANIPEDVLVKHYSEDQISAMTVEFSIDSVYQKALMEEKIIPVAQGEIKEIISQSPLKFKLHIEVLPKVEVDAKYKKIKLKKQKITVSDAEVKQALEDIEKRFTTFKEVSDKKSKADLGDRVTIDTDGYEKEKLLDSTSMRDYPLVLGSGLLVPGFEEGIVGAKLEDELELDITFPKDYHNADFASKKTKFKVKIKKIEKATKPEFTPEFIEQLRGQKLDLAGFKKLIKQEIKDTKESNTRLDQEHKLIDELVKVSKLSVGEKLLENQINKIFAEIKENMGKQGIKMADYLESLKLSEEDYKEKHVKLDALKRLQGELILNKLMEIEKVEVDDKTLEEEIEKIKGAYQNPEVLKRLNELYTPGNKYYDELRLRMAYTKLIDSFFEEEKAEK